MRAIRLVDRHRLVTIAMCCVLLLTACATDPQQSQQQAAGALTGALLGAAVGGLAGKDVKSAIIGAAAGGVLGFAAVTLSQYQARQVRTAEEDQKVYGLTPVNTTPLVKIRSSSCTPTTVRKQGQMDFIADYSVSAPGNLHEINVEEALSVKKADGQVLVDLMREQKVRQPGGYQVGGKIQIPASVEPGEYFIEFKIRTGTSYDVVSSVFKVAG